MEYSLFGLYCMFVNKNEIYDEELKCTRLVDLKDIADRFKIPVDRRRIKDYEVLDINVQSTNNYLKIYDKKLKKEYFSEYSFLSDICNIREVFGGINLSIPSQFVNVTSTCEKSKCQYTYFINGDVPIVERLSYIDECNNDFYHKLQITKYNEVELKKKYSSLANPRLVCIVDYIKGINCNVFGTLETVCLRKKHNNFVNNDINFFCDEEKVYPKVRNVVYDRSCWIHNNKVNYYINPLKDEINDFQGICFEKINYYSDDMFYNILEQYNNMSSYCEVSLCNNYSKVESVLLFSQNTDYNKEKGDINENILEVFKTDKDIVIRYSVVPEKMYGKKLKHENIKTKDIIISKQNDNCFNESELDNISRIVANFNDDKFIKRVLYEIDKYKKLLQFKGDNYYFQDPLSPLLLSNIDISDIEKMISRYPDYYFNVARHQIDKYVNQKSVDLNKTKVLKYKNNKIKE